MMRHFGAFVIFLLEHILFVNGSSFRFEVTSPLSGAYYIQETGTIVVSTLLHVVNGVTIYHDTLPSFLCCTSIFEIQSIDDERVLLSKECHTLSEQVKMQPFDTQDRSPGSYAVVFEIINSSNQVDSSETVTFFYGRRQLQYALHGPTDGQATSMLLVLAIKYGIHGDDSTISVAWDGTTIISIPMYKLFKVDDIRADLTNSLSKQDNFLGKLETTLDRMVESDITHLSDHLALQMASGFATGCQGIFVTKSGVTRTCDDPKNIQERWHGVAGRIQKALSKLLPSDRNAVFDAILFLSSPEDEVVSKHSPTALVFAQNAFKSKVWVFDDNIVAVSDPALVVWAPPHDLPSSHIFDDQHSLGAHIDDQTSPQMSTLSTDLNIMIRKLLRRVKKHRKPFTVCRPGLGWDTTLAHRRLVAPYDSVTSLELALLRDFVGVWIDEDDITSLNQYLDEWNESLLTACDVVAVFPACEGRVADYCHLGLSTRASSGTWRRCDTGDARMVGGVSQLVNHDTWLQELRGLRVLVIHPFASSITTQYKKHMQLVKDGVVGGIFGERFPNALPVFKELLTLVPPVGNADGKEWKAQLELFQEQLKHLATAFDVALIGAGGFGPILNRFIRKELNLSSIYVGGALQVHFAVLGGRFNNSDYFPLISDAWVWPLEEETARLQRHLPGSFHEYAQS